MAFGFFIHKAGSKRILNCTPFQHGRFAKVTCWNSIVEVEPPLDVFGLRAFNYSKIMDCFITRLSFGLRAFGAGSAEEVEAQACREGLTLAAEWTSGPIILESDCAAVVSYLVNPTSQRSASYFVIREALEVAGRVPGVEFRHTGRACNRLAHELAQLAKRLNHSAVWRERCPTSVEHLAAQDVNT